MIGIPVPPFWAGFAIVLLGFVIATLFGLIFSTEEDWWREDEE